MHVLDAVTKLTLTITAIFEMGNMIYFGDVNPYKPKVPFLGLGKQCRPRLDAASDQGLHCLLTGISIENIIKRIKYTRHR